jgi:hypothetical protein
MVEMEVGDYILLCYVSFTKKTSKQQGPKSKNTNKEAPGLTRNTYHRHSPNGIFLPNKVEANE